MSFNSATNTVNLSTNNGTNGGSINISNNNITSTNVFNGGVSANFNTYYPFSTLYSNTPTTSDPSITTKNNFYYYLPFDTNGNLRLLIQWGTVPDVLTVKVMFNKSYAVPPFVWIQPYSNAGQVGYGTTIDSINLDGFTADPQYGNANKGPFQFLAIGFVGLT